MGFRDQSRINHVRDALWRRGGGASVMVGSGFSRNAEAKAPGGRVPPDWAGVSKAMARRLPSVPEEEARGDSGAEAPAVAQRYCDEFGRAELHRFLREQVRDDDVEPGKLHRRLLGLPWADVFTTNWDTLLERTRDSVVTPAYEVVHAVDELPLAARPRIVKLHGSLPAQFPLIATENDYGEYPERFAPFVNTARQAMMETVFLLLGFSGDDPNFERWSEWVRRQLGSSAPRIYLAGWLGLDEDGREELEEKGVVPIDVSRHPKGKEWERAGLKHAFATDWLVTTLELGRTYPAEEWPKALPPPEGGSATHLQPLDGTAWRAPTLPPGLPGAEEEDEPVPTGTVDGIVSAWGCNRALYPGWLALPEQLRGELMDPWKSGSTGDLFDSSKEDRIVAGMGGRALRDRLRIVHEVAWRRGIRLEPLGEALAAEARQVLAEVEARRGDDECDRAEAAAVAMALVTHARFGFVQEEFDEAVRVASGFAEHDPNTHHAVDYEKCLWALYGYDMRSLGEGLDAWQADGGDPQWLVRKASLMFEGGHRSGDAPGLVRDAVAALRRSRGYRRDIGVLSRESWAAYLAKALETRSWSDGDGSDPQRARTQELARFNCDPRAEIGALRSAVAWSGESAKGPGFELGQGTRPHPSIVFRDAGIPTEVALRSRAAYRLVRLAEVAGMPTMSNRWPPTRYMLGQACEALQRDGQSELALRLMLRITSYDGDDLLRKLLSRANVAGLPQPIVDSMVGLCSRTIDYYVDRGLEYEGADGTISPRERLRVAMEALARLALRLRGERAVAVFRKALALYEDRTIHGDTLFRDGLRHLLSWTWKALRDDERAALSLAVLGSSIVGVDGYSAAAYGFLDPGEVIGRGAKGMAARDGENEASWAKTVRFLLRALDCGEEAAGRAMRRLAHVALAGRLVQDERALLARALWNRDRGPLPGQRTLRHWVFLCMPETVDGVAREWFRTKWMKAHNADAVDDETLDQTVFQIGCARDRSRQEAFALDFSEGDVECVVGILRRWAAAPLPQLFLPAFERERVAWMNWGVEGAASLLAHVDVPEDVAEAVYAKQQKLLAAGTPAMSLLPGLVGVLQERASEIHTMLRKGLSSDDGGVVASSAGAMQLWLDFAAQGSAPRPPADLVREIGVVIATRRPAALAHALRVAEWVFAKGGEPERTEIRRLALEGLGFLVEELDYGRELEDDMDVPLLRWGCVGLARAMHECGCTDKAVVAWLEAGRADPMPEVWHQVAEIAL